MESKGSPQLSQQLATGPCSHSSIRFQIIQELITHTQICFNLEIIVYYDGCLWVQSE
jgi:hypothetical protein